MTACTTIYDRGGAAAFERSGELNADDKMQSACFQSAFTVGSNGLRVFQSFAITAGGDPYAVVWDVATGFAHGPFEAQ